MTPASDPRIEAMKPIGDNRNCDVCGRPVTVNGRIQGTGYTKDNRTGKVECDQCDPFARWLKAHGKDGAK
jgi:hypothetical protein